MENTKGQGEESPSSSSQVGHPKRLSALSPPPPLNKTANEGEGVIFIQV